LPSSPIKKAPVVLLGKRILFWEGTMTRSALCPAIVLFYVLFATQCFSQSGAVIPEKAAAGHSEKASCVLLKRMGPADQVTSRLYSFGIRGKQFQYVEGKLPDGFPFHGRLTDHDVRNLQGRGAEVIVLNQNYTAEDLKQARADCQRITGKTPLQGDATVRASEAAPSAPGDAKLAPASATGVAAVAAAHPNSEQASAQLRISSTPEGADIEIDGNYVGSTPSTVGARPGEHQISLQKSGFKPWQRKITVSSGQINVNASLAPESK
jgi:hypothetical protein